MRGRGGGGGGGTTCTGWYKGVPAVRTGSVADRTSLRLSHKRICEHFNEGNWAQFGRSADCKRRELRNVLELVDR